MDERFGVRNGHSAITETTLPRAEHSWSGNLLVLTQSSVDSRSVECELSRPQIAVKTAGQDGFYAREF